MTDNIRRFMKKPKAVIASDAAYYEAQCNIARSDAARLVRENDKNIRELAQAKAKIQGMTEAMRILLSIASLT